MKHTRILLLLGTAALLTGCGEKKTQQDIWVAPERESVVSQMPDYHLADSTRMGSHCYHYDIMRLASDSLPMVKDELNDLYRDNTIHLVLQRDGQTYFDKTLTKAIFASHIDEAFYPTAILAGIRFIRAVAGQGLTFSLAVSQPESDMSMPFLMTITDQGTFSFVKDETPDVEAGDSAFLSDEGV